MNATPYRGTGLPPSGDASKKFPYLADEQLAKVVNMANHLARVSNDHAPCQDVLPGRDVFTGLLAPMT